MTSIPKENSIEMPKTYGPNWGVITISAFLSLACIYGALKVETAPGEVILLYCTRTLLVLLPVTMLLWLVSIRLSLDATGIKYRSIFHKRDIGWDKVHSIKHSSKRMLLNASIPFWESASYEVVGGNFNAEILGKTTKTIGWFSYTKTNTRRTGDKVRIAFGLSVDDAHLAFREVEARTLPIILDRVVSEIERNNQVSFTTVIADRDGLRDPSFSEFMDGMFAAGATSKAVDSTTTSPWGLISSSFVEKGQLVVGTNKGEQRWIPVSGTTNFHVLVALIDLKSASNAKKSQSERR